MDEPILILQGFFEDIEEPENPSQYEDKLQRDCEIAAEREQRLAELQATYARLGITPPKG